MAIQHRRGADVDFKAEKMLPGEIAVTIDGTRKVYAAFAPGDVKELASKEEVQKIVDNFENSVDEKINEAVQQVTDEATEQVEGIVAKGEEILDSIPVDYQETVKEVTQLKEDLAKTTQSKADAIICEAEGTTIVATDSSNAGFEGLSLYGKSKQGSTTGAQLIPDENVVAFNNGNYVCSSPTYEYERKGDIPISEKQVYTFSLAKSSGDAKIYIYDASNNVLTTTRIGTFTTPENAVSLSYYAAITNDGTASFETAKIMLNAGSTPLPWEPYTGNKPSPNPEYPQEVVSVGIGGSIEGKVCGKNIVKSLDITAAMDIYNQALRVDAELKPSTTYTLSYKDSTGNAYYCNENIQTSGSLVQAVNGICKFTFTTKDTLDKNNTHQYVEGIGWIFLKNHKDNSAHMFEDFQIEYGTEATAYEPYLEKTLTLQTPNGLPGIPVSDASLANYTDENGQMWCADEIDVERGVYVKRVGVVQPTEWRASTVASNTTGYRYVVTPGMKPIQYIPVVCSHYIQSTKSSYTQAGNYVSTREANTDGRIHIRTTDESLSTLERFTEWVVKNNMLVFYILATPIETPLSDEEILAYKALHTNKPTTTIMNSDNAYMKVKYVADTKNHIKQNYVPLSEYTALEERVAAIEELVIS